MITKTQKAIQKFHDGDPKGALAIVSKFRRFSEKRIELFRFGYECMIHHKFYQQIHGNKVVGDAINDAIVELGLWVHEIEEATEKKLERDQRILSDMARINHEFDQLVFAGS